MNILPYQGERVAKFGFDTETCCGSPPQSNQWSTDWPAFYTNKLQAWNAVVIIVTDLFSFSVSRFLVSKIVYMGVI